MIIASIYVRIGMIAVVVLIAWLVVFLLRSRKFDKFCNDLEKGNLKDQPSTKDTMSGITNAEKDLGKQAVQNTKQAEKLKTETGDIKDFLGKRGVTDTKKGGG